MAFASSQKEEDVDSLKENELIYSKIGKLALSNAWRGSAVTRASSLRWDLRLGATLGD